MAGCQRSEGAASDVDSKNAKLEKRKTQLHPVRNAHVFYEKISASRAVVIAHGSYEIF